MEATFSVEGSQEPIVVRRVWKDAAELDESELRVRRGSERLAGLEALGWAEPLTAFRPFLCYSELGALLEEPSKLYDELKSILGLDEISQATNLLTEARKERDAQRKRATEELSRLTPRLDSVDDTRAKKCLDAVSGKVWELDEVEAAVLGDSEADRQDAAMSRLRRLAHLEAPELTEVERAVSELRASIHQRAELARSSEAQTEKLARVLEAALRYHSDFGGGCPVCERELARHAVRPACGRSQSTLSDATLARAPGHAVGAVSFQLKSAEECRRAFGLPRARPPDRPDGS